MKVVQKSYNVLTIDIGSVENNTPKVVGTLLDYQMIKKCTSKSGVIRVKATISGNQMFGSCGVNPWAAEDKLECVCSTNYGGTIKWVIATVEPVDSGCQVTVSVQTI